MATNGLCLALVFVALGAGAGLGTILGHLNVIMNAYPHSVGLLGVFFWLIAAGIAFRYAMGGALARPVRGGRRRGPAGGSYGDPWPPFRPAAAAPYAAAEPSPGERGPSPYAAPLPPTDPYGLPHPGEPESSPYPPPPLPPTDPYGLPHPGEPEPSPYGLPQPASQHGTSPPARPGQGQHAADWPPDQQEPGQPASGPGFPLPRRVRPAGRHSRPPGRPPA